MSSSEHEPAAANEIVRFHLSFGTAERVLELHVDDGTGHCAGCAWQDIPRPVWPCDHAHYARVAHELANRATGPPTVSNATSLPSTGT